MAKKTLIEGTDHFYWEEFACKCKRCEPLTEEDAERDGIRLLAQSLEKFRYVLCWYFQMDVPIFINSGYRCPEHNMAVYKSMGKKPQRESMHLHGLAADIRVDMGIDPFLMAHLANLVPDFEKGGIGIYAWGLHLDLRWILGRRSTRWDETE